MEKAGNHVCIFTGAFEIVEPTDYLFLSLFVSRHHPRDRNLTQRERHKLVAFRNIPGRQRQDVDAASTE